jgi:hypothetical protein
VFAHWTFSGSTGGGGGTISTYTITASSGPGGSISPAGSVTAAKGQDATFTVKADAGYVISDVVADGKSVGVVETYTFSNVAANHTISAVFEKVIAFNDVAEADWFFGAVLYVAERGVMTGTTDGLFSPGLSTSRGMLVTMLHRLENEPAVSGSGFSDVPDGIWYSDAVRGAAANGIVSGYGTGLFGPNDSLAREQMVTILYNYANYKGYDTTAMADLTGFADASQGSAWSSEAMRWAVGSGLIVGKGAGLLDPGGTSTRAEIATVIMRFCEMYLE